MRFFIIFIIPILVGVVNGNALRTINYRDGNTEDSVEDSEESLEDLSNTYYGELRAPKSKVGGPFDHENSRIIVANAQRDVVIMITGQSEKDDDSFGNNERLRFSESNSRGRTNRLGLHNQITRQRVNERERLDLSNYNNQIDDSSVDDPPPHQQVAKMARYIVHNSEWTSLATISTMSGVRGYPFVNIISISDGPVANSTGIPYFYMTSREMSAIDLENDNRASLTMTLAQSDYCKTQNYDPEDPRCAHVILSGHIVPVTDAQELSFATNALYTRHPAMEDWPKDHGWFFAKLVINHVVVLDYFGGVAVVKPDDYFKETLLW